ncbi:MAG: hypothetical protein AAGC44_06380 [Planctomycetota bacterium]
MNLQPTTMKSCVLLAAGALGLPALGQSYEHSYQYAYGSPAQFDMIGPATEGNSNGDALLQSVTMPNGEVYEEFYRPVSISHFSYAGNANNFKALAGSDCTVGVNTTIALKNVDGNGSKNASEADLAGMPEHILNVLETENLNNYIDTSTNDGWEFVMKFDLPLKDNDEDPDDFGELLYFERGDGGGNSWMTFLAVDENNVPLPGATPLAVSPTETVLTTPRTVLSGGQDMGAVAIDLSRLGVSETTYLRVMRSESGVGGYTSGEVKADFKIMAVITHPEQLTKRNALYD